MALVIGDIHGRLKKAERFLAYKPEVKHIFAGDYADSFDAKDTEIYNTLKLVIESDADLIIGNHDLHYFGRPPFSCTGFRPHMVSGLGDIFESFIDRFEPAIAADGFLITHGGLTTGLADMLYINYLDLGLIMNKIQAEWEHYLEIRLKAAGELSPIFHIGRCRGGDNKFSGIFWADYREDEMYDIPQIFGHSKTAYGCIIEVKRGHWALGCDNDNYICFNTATQLIEEFT